MADVILVVTAILQAKMMCLQLWENPESFKFCLTQHMTRCPQLSGKTIVVSVHSANIHSLAYITYKTSYDANINPCSACKEICNCGLCPYSDQTDKMVSPSAYFIPKVCKNFLKFFISFEAWAQFQYSYFIFPSRLNHILEFRILVPPRV